MPTLRQLEIFLTAARAGSLGQAAGKLGISQPCVSKQIQSIERQLGGQLFIRRRGASSKLTELGEEMVGQAQELVERHRKFRRPAAQAPDAMRPDILVRHSLLTRITRHLAELFPPEDELQPTFCVVDERAALLEELRHRENAFCVFHHIAVPNDPDFDVTLLKTEACSLYVASEAASLAGAGRDNLNAIDWVICNGTPGLAAWLRQMMQACGIDNDRIVVGPQFIDATLDLVIASKSGGMFMDRFAQSAVARGKLVRLPHTVSPLFFVLASHRNCNQKVKSRLQQAFRDL